MQFDELEHHLFQVISKMGEMSKQVRVDNWGVFLLQRLQTFFNKTDYCDLTLQFEGNVQLKVWNVAAGEEQVCGGVVVI